ncbi:hypothetical protein ACVWWR_006529 [Bradyrhizobium sp. LM3.2]
MPREQQRVQAIDSAWSAVPHGSSIKKRENNPMHSTNQHKSLKNFAPHCATPASEGGLTRRAKQAQNCTIPDYESASRAAAIAGSKGTSDRDHVPPTDEQIWFPLRGLLIPFPKLHVRYQDRFAAERTSTRRCETMEIVMQPGLAADATDWNYSSISTLLSARRARFLRRSCSRTRSRASRQWTGGFNAVIVCDFDRARDAARAADANGRRRASAIERLAAWGPTPAAG